MPEAEHFTLRSYSAHNTRGYFNLGKKEQILLPRRRKRIFQDSREGLQLQDAPAWQWQVAGVENGRVERRHGVESTDKRQEERERERERDSVQFDSLFLFFFAAISSDQLSSILRMTIAATTTMSASLLLLNSLMSPESGPLLELQCGGDELTGFMPLQVHRVTTKSQVFKMISKNRHRH